VFGHARAILAQWRADNRSFWGSNWRATLVFAVLTGFIGTVARYWTEGRDLAASAPEALALAVLGTGASAAAICVIMLISYLVLAPSRVWSRDQNTLTALQTRVDELTERQRPRLGIFVTNPTHRRFRFKDPLVVNQEIVTVGVRCLGVDPVHNINVLIDDYAPANESTPQMDINTVEPVEIVRGGLWFGHARRGQPVYGQIVTVRQLPDADLPEVRVCYMNDLISGWYPAFPSGEWLLRIMAAGEESPAAYAFFRLTVKDDREDRVQLTMLGPDEIAGLVAKGGAVAAVLTNPPADDDMNERNE